MCDHSQPCFNADPNTLPSQRREFLKLAVLGGGAALYLAASPFSTAQSATTDALLLSCMDFRLTDDIVRYMDGRGMNDKYDHVVLAGASLGALTEKFAEWGKTFSDHLQVAIDLHHIKQVIIMDHRDCGAYKTILGEDFAKDPAKELQEHSKYLNQLAGIIRKQRPDLQVETLLMNLDGTVETVPS